MNESFNVKAVSYVIGSPDEVANALTEEKTRQLWDPNLKSMEKLFGDAYKLTYTSSTHTNGD